MYRFIETKNCHRPIFPNREKLVQNKIYLLKQNRFGSVSYFSYWRESGWVGSLGRVNFFFFFNRLFSIQLFIFPWFFLVLVRFFFTFLFIHTVCRSMILQTYKCTYRMKCFLSKFLGWEIINIYVRTDDLIFVFIITTFRFVVPCAVREVSVELANPQRISNRPLKLILE